MEFTKMHGLGNDYVYVNCFSQTVDNPTELAVAVSDRHFGIGSDGLILICPSDIADARMRIFNADGSEAQMCGNGIRCVAKYVYDHNLARPQMEFSVPGLSTFPTSLQIETQRGVLTLGLDINENDNVSRVCVNMGQPILNAAEIPVAADSEMPVGEHHSKLLQIVAAEVLIDSVKVDVIIAQPVHLGELQGQHRPVCCL